MTNWLALKPWPRATPGRCWMERCSSALFWRGFSIHAFAFQKIYAQNELAAERALGMRVTLDLVGVFSSRKFTQNTLWKDCVPPASAHNALCFYSDKLSWISGSFPHRQCCERSFILWVSCHVFGPFLSSVFLWSSVTIICMRGKSLTCQKQVVNGRTMPAAHTHCQRGTWHVFPHVNSVHTSL